MADDLAAAVRAYEVARSAVTDARDEEAARIVAAAKTGVVAARKRLADAIVAGPAPF
ncbi:hypothetical protein [Micromonospora arborensis]|uniref:hypothetical protein n=1 Tax=Micromonospora arborensis TaxID=2116518 RepID=UPI00142D2C57|nr:hypothetical protein [Micromonospora arborensis]